MLRARFTRLPMHNRLISVFCLALLPAAFLLAGCRHHPQPVPVSKAGQKQALAYSQERSPGITEAIRARQDVRYQNVVLWKPAQPEESLAFQFAPLIIQPAHATNGFLSLNPLEEINVVFTGADTLLLGGKPYARVFYLWNGSMLQPGGNPTQHAQGIRLTLGPSGRPVIWETLTDSTGAQIVFVADALEEAAKKQFGPPLDGRLLSVEPAHTNRSPQIIVARVLQDGPLPMGPIIYLSQSSRDDIATVICRCMPSQATNVVSTREYKLQLTGDRWPKSETGIEPLEALRLPSLEGL